MFQMFFLLIGIEKLEKMFFGGFTLTPSHSQSKRMYVNNIRW